MSNAWDANKEQLRRSTRKLESISPPTCRMNTTYFSHGLGGCFPWFIATKGWACCNPFGWSSLGCAKGHRRTNTGDSLEKLFLCQQDAACSQGMPLIRERGQHPSALCSKINNDRQETKKQTLHLVLNPLKGEGKVARVGFNNYTLLA